MKRLLALFIGCISIAANAQFTYQITQDIPVIDLQGNGLVNAWAGGLNAAQYNTMDLNQDGKEDLVLFDRMANKALTFLNIDNSYRYHPEFEAFFPDKVSNWMLLRDFNCDGRKDIFTGDILGIKVFRNTSEGSSLSWEQVLFGNSPVILTEGFDANNKINLQIQYDDLPSIEDVDGDGDLDIFTMRYATQGTIEFHQNQSSACGGLEFKRMTQSWGGVRECGCGSFTFNNTSCTTGGRTKHAGGKSLLAIDADGDQDMDLLLSEAECTKLYLLKNDGTTNAPHVTEAVEFPAGNPINYSRSPAAFYEDIDFDGVRDLISTPNIFSKESQASDLKNSNFFFKNTGTNKSPIFSFTKPNFLQDQMIDVGDNAIPAFADADGDGDQDMFISRNAIPNSAATLSYFENTGTPGAPSFQLRDEDYLDFSTRGLYNVKIQFVDANQNGSRDLVFTGTNLETKTTNPFYIINKAQGSLDFTEQAIQPVDFKLTQSENLYLTDVSSDGIQDILVGRSEGSLEYWRNVGGLNFLLQNASYLNLGESVARQNLAASAEDLNGDGESDLISGYQTGTLFIINNYRNASSTKDSVVNIIYNPLKESYGSTNLGGRVWPTVVNLFNTDKPSIVVGNLLGGVSVLQHTNQGTSQAEYFIADVYPNPITRNQSLNIRTNQSSSIQIISSSGRQISATSYAEANETVSVSISNLPAGLYLLKFISRNKSHIRRLVIR